MDDAVARARRRRGRHDLRHRQGGRRRAGRRDRPHHRARAWHPWCWSPRDCPAAASCCRMARRAADARWTIIVDPIDGTRGLMYQKRPAWILTGVAHPTRQPAPTDRTSVCLDIVLAVQTEIPLVKQHLCDELWAVAGQGARGIRVNRLTGRPRARCRFAPRDRRRWRMGLRPSRASFPAMRAELAALDDEIAATLLGPPVPGRRSCSRTSTSRPAANSTSSSSATTGSSPTCARSRGRIPSRQSAIGTRPIVPVLPPLRPLHRAHRPGMRRRRHRRARRAAGRAAQRRGGRQLGGLRECWVARRRSSPCCRRH